MTVLHNDSNLHTAGNPELRRPAVSQTGIMTVFEHQRLTARDFAYVTDFEWLLTQEFAVFGIKRKRGQWQLQVGHYIGIVHLPSGMVLEILPKRMAATNTPPQRQSPSQQQSAISRTRLWVQRMLPARARLEQTVLRRQRAAILDHVHAIFTTLVGRKIGS